MHPLLLALALAAPNHSHVSTEFSTPTASEVTGTVLDSAGKPIPEARVTLIELKRSSSTTPEGRFVFSAVAPGQYHLSVSAIGFAPTVEPLIVTDRDTSVTIRLKPSVVELQALQVTASPNATTLLNSPQPVSALSQDELRQAQSPSLGETIERMPGVRSLSTGTGIGKPVIRGLTSNRVLVVADGQRLETQQWGDEHSPNVDTGDAERIEVIRGPASVLYGSDALGGVVNVVPKEQPDATLALEGASGGLGFRGSLTGRTSDDIRTPAFLMFHSAKRSPACSGAS